MHQGVEFWVQQRDDGTRARFGLLLDNLSFPLGVRKSRSYQTETIRPGQPRDRKVRGTGQVDCEIVAFERPHLVPGEISIRR